MSKVKAVAATIVLMLCASVSYAQSSQTPLPVFPSSQSPGNIQFQSQANRPSDYANLGMPSFNPGPMYVACRAEVPSHNTAYFSATFQAPAVSSARKEFRQLVTTQYGPVSNLQCAGKFNQAVVNEQVEKWKDSARSTKNAIVDTDWQPTAALREPGPSSPYLESLGARMKRGTAVEMQTHPDGGSPSGFVPGNNSSGTVAGQSNFQR